MWKWLTQLFGSKAKEPAAAYLQQQASRTSARVAPARTSPARAAPRPATTRRRPEDVTLSGPRALRDWLTASGIGITTRNAQGIYGALKRGRKLEAIKLLRVATDNGIGLKQAKDLVDALEAKCR